MAEEPKFTIRLAKIKNNRLLDRIQMVCDVYYEPKAKITKELIKKKLLHNLKNLMLLFSVLKKPMVVVKSDALLWYMILKTQ